MYNISVSPFSLVRSSKEQMADLVGDDCIYGDGTWQPSAQSCDAGQCCVIERKDSKKKGCKDKS